MSRRSLVAVAVGRRASCSPSRSALRLDLGSSESLDKATSGRYDLIDGGLDLARERPLPAGARAPSTPVPPPRADARARGEVGLAHDPDHRRRRAGRDRAARPTSRCSCRARAPAARSERRRRRARRRRRLRGAGRAHVAVRRVPRGSGDVDAAGARHRARRRPPRRAHRAGGGRGGGAERPPPRAGGRGAHRSRAARRAASRRRSSARPRRSRSAVAVLVWALTRTYPNYDSYYHLVWGRELLDGLRRPSRPTPRRPSTRCGSRSARCSGWSSARAPTARSCSSACSRTRR